MRRSGVSAVASCPRCGQPILEGHRFCPRCGLSLVAGAGAGGPPGEPLRARKVPRSDVPAAAAAAGPASSSPGYASPGRPPVARIAAAGPMVTGTFDAWAKDVPAYLGLYLVYGAAALGIVFGITWALLGVAVTPSSLPTVSPSSSLPSLPGDYVVVAFLANVVNAVVGAVFTATVTYYALRKRRGARVRWSVALREGARRWRTVLGGSLLLGVLGFTFTALSIVPFLGTEGGQLSAWAVGAECGLLLLALPVLYLTLALGLYAPAVMMEGLGAIASLRRSWTLTRGHRLSLFGAYLLMGLIGGSALLAASLSANASGNPVAVVVAQLASTSVVGSWPVLLLAVAYELIGEEQRAQALDWAAMARVPPAALPETAPAYERAGAPPCPACGQPLLWVPAYGRWYCVRCQAYR